MRKNLDTWLKRVCSADQSLRFGTLFDLLVTAQLPGFRTHLHCLHLCEVPDSCLPAVQDAWEEWHIEAPWLEVPDDVPEILSRLVSVEYGLSLAQTLYHQSTKESPDVHVEVLGWLWEMAFELKEELNKLKQCLPPE